MAKPFLFGKVDAAKLLKELHEIVGEIPEAVKQTDEAVAGDLARDAQALAVALGGVHAHVAPGIRASGRMVGLDVGAQPAILGAEFGGGARPRTRQFPPWRGAGSEAGYMLYETIRRRKVVEKHYDALLDELTD